ncbi:MULTISPECIES: DMT family transporter [unclassified Fusibacter]|uniref:DMT family transporter n=1 Tax=unclassified Fusibacter TaxID=2624464 RepID=UPI001011800F|nr:MULTISPECIES: DMT family transporter [unclassified Fusibacter]MCK8059733.1 DMT family transporter [Fusibacter sp. A2]NPE21534.1 DMT family transporter [Fusibacter sp. A1]RXV61943.1 DMT family transporter [Fusibacter sp. A1]
MDVSSKKPSLRAAYGMLFFSATGWAISTIVMKLFIDELPAFHLMLGRFALAALMFGIIKRKSIKMTRKLAFHGTYLGFFLFLAYYFAVISLSYTTASKSGFLVALSVLWVPLVQLVFKRQKPNKWVVLSVTTSLIGLYWISGLDGLGFNSGDAMAIGCSVAYTAYIMLIDKYTLEMNEDQMTFVILLVVAIFSLISTLIFEGLDLKILIDGWLPILVISVFGSSLSTYFQTRAQQVASPESVGIIMLGEPLLTLLMAIFILKESVTTMGLIGGSLLLVSLVIAVVKKV